MVAEAVGAGLVIGVVGIFEVCGDERGLRTLPRRRGGVVCFGTRGV